MEKKAARKFTDEFKHQMVNLHNNGKPSSEIIKEYDLTPSAFHEWVKKYNKTGSFKAADNQTALDGERYFNKVGLLVIYRIKQAALIMGRK